MTVHGFDEKLAEGERFEKKLDRWFRSQGWDIEPASPEEQRRGIDRFLMRDGERWSVEYKSDSVAAQSGRAFIELYHEKPNGISWDGWRRTSRADWLVYFIPPLARFWLFWMSDIPTNGSMMRRAPNADYDTVGFVLPLREFETYSFFTASIAA